MLLLHLFEAQKVALLIFSAPTKNRIKCYPNIGKHLRICYLISGSCFTNNGPSAEHWCQLPFSYKGRTYSTCTYEESFDGRPWCSVKVDDKGHHVENEGNWGYCNDFCPIDFKGSLHLFLYPYMIE